MDVSIQRHIFMELAMSHDGAVRADPRAWSQPGARSEERTRLKPRPRTDIDAPLNVHARTDIGTVSDPGHRSRFLPVIKPNHGAGTHNDARAELHPVTDPRSFINPRLGGYKGARAEVSLPW